MARHSYQTEKLNACGLYPERVSVEEWDNIAGMNHEKQLIESKILLPLLNPELARKHGVSLPKTMLLFGPPGTGKTSFARGIASKLDWGFIEISPSQLIREGLDKQALWLRTVFGELQGVDKAVIFLDEFEQLAHLLEGTSKGLRHIKVRTVSSIHKKAYADLVKAASRLNSN